MAQNELPVDIPSFAKPLAPYIKSRQEALRIRQALTLYLQSHIDLADDDPANQNRHARSHLALCVPHDAVVDVKRIPPELTGLRKEYLKALQANVATRKKYDSLKEKVATAKLQRETSLPSSTPAVGDAGSELETYISLLRERRRHAKLQVFWHYLQQLRTRGVERSEYFESPAHRSQPVPSPEEFEAEVHSTHGAEGGVEGLVYKLEKAVIRAKAQLDREKALLEELKRKHGSKPCPEVSPAIKVRALQRARDELVQWVEEKLMAVSGSEDTPLREIPPEEIEQSAQLLEERKEQIRQQYAVYVRARKDLLDAISEACQPVAASSSKPQRRIARNDKITAEPPASSVDFLNVLSFASESLLPLSKSQKALALQKSYLAGLLAKEKYTTLRTLNRLSDESHLLPEYPILARQPRFKHAVAAIDSRSSIDSTQQEETDEVVSLAEAWAFASKAARENEREFVQQKVELGAEIVQNDQQTLREVYNMLNQDLDEVLQDEKTRGDNDADIWTSEARSTGTRRRATRTEKRSKGPWSHLDGRIGLTGDMRRVSKSSNNHSMH